ncbi:hypothetical protein Tco_0877515 [Tanacetum coccineum]|uniref:Uncharacterized protein n=1 Tax=Tanacetum coccineum TaxID=301880 RepID=A0ABQ5C0K5_9ASTR
MIASTPIPVIPLLIPISPSTSPPPPNHIRPSKEPQEKGILAEKLQDKKDEQFTIEERAKFLHDTIAAQRMFLAQQRSQAIRNKPPTKNQLRNRMITFLKHVGNFKHANLKGRKFEDIQALYEKIKRFNEHLFPLGCYRMKGVSKG